MAVRLTGTLTVTALALFWLNCGSSGAVGGEGQAVGSGDRDRAGHVELVEQKPVVQILGRGVGAGLV